MVQRTLRALSSKIAGLHEAAFWLASFSVLSQILAFFRDRLLAYHFGAGHSLDLYYASFEIPDLIFATASSLVSASILVPLFAKWGAESNDSLKKYVDSVFTAFSALILICCVLAFIFMPYLMPIFFKGFDAEALTKVITYSRILLLSPLFLGLSNFFGSIVQYEKRFLLYSLSPLLYNVGIVCAAFFGASRFGVAAVVIGVVSGAFLHMIVQAVWVLKNNAWPRITSKLEIKEVKNTFLLSVPRTISLGASSLVGLFFVAIASKLGEGAIAVFNFSFNLQSVPLVLIGASYSLAAFPTLADHYVKKELRSLTECLSGGLRHIIFWSVPVASLFIILRAHIVRVVLGSGAFNWEDTRITAAVMSIFVISIVFQSIQLYLTRAHYAFHKTRLPLFINLGSASLTVFLALLMSHFLSPSGLILGTIASLLNVSDIGRTVVLTLPIAFSIGSFISAILLWAYLDSDLREALKGEVLTAFRDSLIFSFCIFLVTEIFLELLDKIFSLDTTIGVFSHAFVSGTIGILFGVLILKIIKNRELQEILMKFNYNSKIFK